MGQCISFDTEQDNLIKPKTNPTLKHGYISTNAFVIVQLSNGMYIMENINRHNI